MYIHFVYRIFLDLQLSRSLIFLLLSSPGVFITKDNLQLAVLLYDICFLPAAGRPLSHVLGELYFSKDTGNSALSLPPLSRICIVTLDRSWELVGGTMAHYRMKGLAPRHFFVCLFAKLSRGQSDPGGLLL